MGAGGASDCRFGGMDEERSRALPDDWYQARRQSCRSADAASSPVAERRRSRRGIPEIAEAFTIARERGQNVARQPAEFRLEYLPYGRTGFFRREGSHKACRPVLPVLPPKGNVSGPMD